MNFYQSISKFYHHIFPLNRVQIDFIRQAYPVLPDQLSVLDIGCAIGDLSLELAKNYQNVVGIDLDSEMIRKAQEKGKQFSNLEFKLENMLNLKTAFTNCKFDIIACFGNTLVHLNSEDEVFLFFKNSKAILNKKGKLCFQIINYDRIINEKIDSLPTIENDHIKFERNYTLIKNNGFVNFETILTCKKSGDIIKNRIQLLALRKSTIEKTLLKAGFSNFSFYGNFKRDSFNDNSMPLIVEASL